MSIPLVVLVLEDTSDVLGRAIAVINNASANNLNAKRRCLIFGKKLFVNLKPLILDILSSAVCFLC